MNKWAHRVWSSFLHWWVYHWTDCSGIWRRNVRNCLAVLCYWIRDFGYTRWRRSWVIGRIWSIGYVWTEHHLLSHRNLRLIFKRVTGPDSVNGIWRVIVVVFKVGLGVVSGDFAFWVIIVQLLLLWLERAKRMQGTLWLIISLRHIWVLEAGCCWISNWRLLNGWP